MSKILLVEDEEELRAMLSEELEADGFKVFAAAEGNEATEILKSHAVDLIVTDLTMNNGSGFDVIQAAGSFTELPVIVITAGGTENLTKYVQVKEVLQKPFAMESLTSTCKEVLNAAGKRVRSQQRYFLESTVYIQLPAREEVAEVELINVSMSGMCIRSRNPSLAPRDLLDFAMNIIDSEADKEPVVRGKGVVRWVRQEETELYFGIEFTGLEEAAALLSRVLETRGMLLSQSAQ